MQAVIDLFPETLGEKTEARRYESALKDKWGGALAFAEFRPNWDSVKGAWVIDWFCFIHKASADEWIQGLDTPPNWPWYRPASQPTAKNLDVACAVAARAVKIVLTQIKEFAQADEQEAAAELIEMLEVHARRWLGAIE